MSCILLVSTLGASVRAGAVFPCVCSSLGVFRCVCVETTVSPCFLCLRLQISLILSLSLSLSAAAAIETQVTRLAASKVTLITKVRTTDIVEDTFFPARASQVSC